ncbi:LacI family DNA-binding transcriptional regulator [Limimaricola litoreus]|uniref:LacI family DNA-binding transcriptional regulator n=1 Tax=Limimaricola litoreus TaxID=2955316 RepID=A0A9X2FQF5_9RHOB|nr:LacI family DNA-binding transcriptional regulator [Limimaricola litoreus]MCP1167934.1 LacI family DNA-binding transcriptional regulator [Limimaricola litoreus]
MVPSPRLSPVAAQAGVPTATLSQVLRGTGRISERTRVRVIAAAEAVNYLPDRRAAGLRSGENREIGMVLHYLANPFNAELMRGVSDRMERAGHLASVLDARDDAAPLGTLSVAPYDLGQAMTERLPARLAAPSAPPVVVEIEARLRLRETTAPPQPAPGDHP